MSVLILIESSNVRIIQFGIDNFAPPKSVGSTVRVAVGLDYGSSLINAGGDLPDVRVFNEAGNFIGMVADPGTVENGGFADITVPMTATAPSRPRDWGRQCGGSWYYSNYFISGTDWKPACMWIDANNDTPQTGFQVHWPEFSKEVAGYPEDASEQADMIDHLCNAGPPFKMHNYPDTDPTSITAWVLDSLHSDDATATSYAPSKHPVSARFQGNRRHPRSNETYHSGPSFRNFVIDDNVEHTGRELCESPTSLGPDYMNIAEGTFCRMSDKTLWPLVIGGVAARDLPYENVIDWTSVSRA
ncbi:hypothetical protein DL764_002040 [Monosporascus ibericus]|uniref:Uncharacterized protein n=1 Tax=Monosporascus ibericus TaxID=155417 RepID=A0A4Q4TM58_9PEZI|nr:hypothetical protein DL764_002040 [Monosporascus ibericus]